MLARLYIKDFALIEEVAIEFGPDLNIITGETGAGKSILLGALNSILGGPVSADLVRSGAARCTVEGLFEFATEDPTCQRLETLGTSLDDGQLVLRREIHASGRSRALANGLSLPLKKLKEIGSILVDLHGQHEHQSLLDVGLHAAYLDGFGGLLPQARKVEQSYRCYKEAERSLQQLRQEHNTLRQEEELRRFQLEEIRSLDPDPREERQLESKLKILESVEVLTAAAGELYEDLYQAEGSILDQLGRARRRFDRIIAIDPALAEQATSLGELIYGLEDLAASLRDYEQKLESDPDEIEQVRSRLDSLRRLKKKYGGSLEKAVNLGRDLEQKEDRSGALIGEILRSEAQLETSRQKFTQACQELSGGRALTTLSLSRAVRERLRDLGMPQTDFEVRLPRVEDPCGLVEYEGAKWQADERGLETVEFYLAANAGEQMRPLARIASGGEISRIMLVLKELIAEKDTVSTLVFDEIDAGISGRIAAAIGKKLQQLSASHQAIVITHLPQIASRGHLHFSVRKRLYQGRTITQVHTLDETERTEEIAHLLGGETISDTARRHAQDILR